jgi:DNA-binding NarL/FixJ family response regulator
MEEGSNVARVATPEEATVAASEPVGGSQADAAGMPARVLVVDDDIAMRSALSDVLESFGFLVVGVAPDAPRGVFLADQLAPEVVVMDLRMPGMSGLDALRLIKAHNSSVQVVVLSAFQDATFKRAATDAGAAAYLVKGTDSPRLADIVREASTTYRKLQRG